MACGIGLLMSACMLTADQSSESDPKDPRAQDVTERIRGIDLSARSVQADRSSTMNPVGRSQAAIYLNDGSSASGTAGDAGSSGEGFDLNFENAPVTTVAKVILGDILGAGYSIDPRVQGTVTLSSGRPIPKSDALFVLENALRMSNVALIRDRNSSYRLVPATEAVGSGIVDKAGSAEPGYGITAVPLRYVSAQNVFKLLDAFGIKPNSVRADLARNMLLVQGSGAERRTAMDTILNFDADWMKGQSVGVFPIRNSSPEPIITELEKIMDSGEGGLGQNVVKLQPIARLNSILVVSQKPDYLKKAGVWIARLDRSDTSGENLKVYPLRYGNARAVTALLNEVITGARGGGNLDSASGQIAPGGGAAVSSSGGGLGGNSSSGGFGSGGLGGSSGGTGGSSGTGGLGLGGGNTNQGGLGSTGGGPLGQTPAGRGPTLGGAQAANQGLDNSLGGFGSGGRGTAAGALQNVRITADIANNSVLVYANAEAHRIIEQTLRQIDRPQRQVSIEATIAEVTLNDNLSYGVQFFLKSSDLGLKTDTGSIVNTLGTAALSRVLPGFNLLVGSEATPRIVLDALHGVTNVKVLSNPSLVVLDNQVATLQVGDQVPISTGSATVLTSNNTVVNTIDYRNTGIILRVLPRSNANGNIVLDIEQEISNVAAQSTTTLTPTISQRRVKSSVAVASGQTVLLAGLISDQQNETRSGIPVLDQLPGALGDAFSHQNTTKTRTELILFIRPTVIRDSLDAQVVAEELRTKFNGRLIGNSIPVPVTPAPNVRR